ncbi:DUF6809 family protein [Paenibacillus donghaensis]|uniref:Uncharacterized protein n=1 Tax=Paenibacillus donghaensis TaxID=414771 RepID=A0A2Z2KGQ7_9BACL|nr:DUF6809 family protein [Paenibacillus donghaensis]ASA22403.1 hypothetical protein B9T62_17380 [Paenibacillus donghaensis]
MGSLLEKLFYGNIRPDERIHPVNPEYKLLNEKISKTIESYHKKLSAEEYDQLEKLIDLLGQTTSMYSAAAYTDGFRMGALMMIEVLGERI